ncbi:MAG: branched-chain amino acid ABC transporter permease [Peptococcaceae bacterium]|jgi:branched-chain amino acid transport system permease protein|nr:branched-chain amino acid ABC transporter permease [Peptococcaceae bacterium]
MHLTLLASQFLIGLSVGMTLFVVAAGLTLIFGVLRVINFAHGSLYMLGAFLAYSVASFLGPAGFWPAMLIAPLVVALVSLGIERGLLRFIYDREHLIQILVTYGLVLVFSDLVQIVWGTGFKSLAPPPGLAGYVTVWGAALPRYNLFLFAVGILVAVGLALFLYRTRMGKICRATATDREMVDVLGVRSSRVFAAVFVLGGWLAGLGGALVAPTVSITPGMDVTIIIEAFLVVVIGGLGNVWGALVSSLILGAGESLGVLFLPRLAVAWPFFIAAVILIIKPSGLLKSVW